MRLHYTNPGFDYSLDSIMLFETGEQSEFWRSSLFYFYPELDKSRADALDLPARRDYYAQTLRPTYESILPELNQKLDAYNTHWQDNEPRINDAFSELFGRDLSGQLSDMQGRIALNNVCPRFLDQRAFDVFWRNSERGAMGIALHEMTHFVWFYVWQQHFHDSPADYETPHLKWILSEMVVECYLSHPTLRALDPYFEPENGGCIYPYFYDLTLDGAPLLNHLHRLFTPGQPEVFMESAWDFVQRHEPAIRAHIASSEEKLAQAD